MEICAAFNSNHFSVADANCTQLPHHRIVPNWIWSADTAQCHRHVFWLNINFFESFYGTLSLLNVCCGSQKRQRVRTLVLFGFEMLLCNRKNSRKNVIEHIAWLRPLSRTHRVENEIMWKTSLTIKLWAFVNCDYYDGLVGARKKHKTTSFRPRWHWMINIHAMRWMKIYWFDPVGSGDRSKTKIPKHKFPFHFNIPRISVVMSCFFFCFLVHHEYGLPTVVISTHLLKAAASVRICIIYSAKHFALPQFGCATLDFRFLHFIHTRRHADTAIVYATRKSAPNEVVVREGARFYACMVSAVCVESTRDYGAVCLQVQVRRSLCTWFIVIYILIDERYREWQRTQHDFFSHLDSALVFFLFFLFFFVLKLVNHLVPHFALMHCLPFHGVSRGSLFREINGNWISAMRPKIH